MCLSKFILLIKGGTEIYKVVWLEMFSFSCETLILSLFYSVLEELISVSCNAAIELYEKICYTLMGMY
jgi:hypothetical protein